MTAAAPGSVALPAPSAKARARPCREPVALLALPAAFYLLVAFAIPLALLLVTSVVANGRLTTAGYASFLGDPFSWVVMGNTLRVAALTTLVCLVAGYPVAFALAGARGALQSVLMAALVLPLSVGVIVKAFAWTILLRSDGVLNRLLLGVGVVDTPVRLLFSETGLVLGAVNVFLPFMVLPIAAVVRLIDPRVLDSAATLGASPLYRFVRVTLPLTMPGVIAGVAFVFSMSVSMYVIPTLLMGDRFKTLSVLIARSFLFMRNRPLGSTVSAILLLIAVVVVMASTLLTRRWQPRR